jgi:hypothetical protein
MSKHLIILAVAIFFSAKAFSQNGVYNHVYEVVVTDKKYESKLLQRNVTSGGPHITGTITDSTGEVIRNITVLWKWENMKGDVRTDSVGEFKLFLQPGEFQIQVFDSLFAYSWFFYAGKLERNTRQHLSICLMPRQDENVYEINAKRRLSRRTIQKIKDCIRQTKGTLTCNMAGEYFIQIQM